jgi:DNA-directed RNA polymerase subunit RPC12/RpoP
MIPGRIQCPYCSRDIPLAEHENEVSSIKLGRKVKAMMLFYECEGCSQSFTTTESDTESMRRVNANINREIRKDKICRIESHARNVPGQGKTDTA